MNIDVASTTGAKRNIGDMLLRLVLSLVLVVGLAPTLAGASFAYADDEATEAEVATSVEGSTEALDVSSDVTPLSNTYSLLGEGGEEEVIQWETLTSAGGTLSSGYYKLEENIQLSVDITIESEADVTIDLNGYTLTGTGTSSVVYASTSASLTLEDSTAYYDESGNYVSGAITGGVGKVYATDKTAGGAIYLSDDVTFTMNSGTLSGNTAYYGGAVYGEMEYDSGNSTTIYINDGVISNCSATYGGGIYIASYQNLGKFYMYGGVISNCSATYGGGLWIRVFTAYMYGGSIVNNTAEQGGGILSRYKFYMYGVTITYNNANYGGGIYAWDFAYIYMYDEASICNNTAEYDGGGIWYYPNVGKIYLYGCLITGNTAGNQGGGICSTGDSCYLYVSGEVVVAGNTVNSQANNLYFCNYRIYVIGALSEGASIGVTELVFPGYYAQGSGGYTITDFDASCFFDDTDTYNLVKSGNYVKRGTKKTSIADATVTCEPDTFTYDGTAKIPALTVALSNSETVLTEDDYTVTYKDADGNTVAEPIDAGTYTVVVTGAGEYGKSASTTFTIESAELTSDDVSVTVDNAVYEGSPVEPAVSVYYNDVLLEEGVDYTVSYTDNDAVGAGTATITFIGNYRGEASTTFTITSPKAADIVEQLAGKNRYLTMVEICNKLYEQSGSCETVIICRGNNFPDALVAAGLAGVTGGQVLLSATDEISAATITEIETLAPSYIYVVGDECSISEAAYAQLETLVGTVERVSGKNRYKTALAIYEEGSTCGEGWGTIAFVTTGTKAADALSASTVSYGLQAPVFLVDKTTEVSDEILEALVDGGFTEIVVLGDETSVSEDSLTRIREATGASVVRKGGANRYATSELVAEWALEHGFTTDTVCVSAGQNGKYADALVASSFGSVGACMLLVNDSTSGETCINGLLSSAAATHSVSHVYVLGDENSVSDALYSKIEALFE